MTTCHVHTVSSLCLVNIIQKCPPKTFLRKLSIPFSVLLSRRWKREDARGDKILLCQEPARKVERECGGVGLKDQNRTEKDKRHRKGQRIVQNSFPYPFFPFRKIHSLALCLIAKYLILVLRGLRLHDYTLPAAAARRGGIWPTPPPPRTPRRRRLYA